MRLENVHINGHYFEVRVSIPDERAEGNHVLPAAGKIVNEVVSIVYDTDIKKEIIIKKMQEIAYATLNNDHCPYGPLKDKRFLIIYDVQTTTENYLKFLKDFFHIEQPAIDQDIAHTNSELQKRTGGNNGNNSTVTEGKQTI